MMRPGRPIKVETGELAGWQGGKRGAKELASASSSPTMGFTVLSSIETSFDSLDRKTKEVKKGSGGATASVIQVRL